MTLPDNDPLDEFAYEITVWTGYRGQSGTTSRVAIVMYGDETESAPRMLWSRKRNIFQRASVDSFLLTTDSLLGNLSAIR